MTNEHNPIAELIHQIQKKWTDEVSPFPELKLVRWLIKPEEARLYEGFLKLESTEHGAIPEILVAMLCPFENETTYSFDLINNWIKAFSEDTKTQEKLSAEGKLNNWKPESFIPGPFDESINYDRNFIQMLCSFHEKLIGKNNNLVVALFPYSIHDMKGMRRWLANLLKMGLPQEIAFMIFDHIGENYFDTLFEKYPEITKTLHADLDMDGAVSKIAKMGNPNSPEVKFRKCILEMGQSLQKKDQKRLDEWGEKALQVTQRSGLKSMYATAHIIYAGMLFNFKEFEKIDSLLAKGLTITKQGLHQDDVSCKPLLIQFYGYIAASNQLQKKMKEAISAFEQQGDLATEYDLPGMASTPYRQAYVLSKKSMPQRYDELLQKAFTAGKAMQKEEKLHSGFAAIAFDSMQWHKEHQRWDEADEIDRDMKELFGENWEDQVKDPETAYKVGTQNSVTIN